LKPRHDVICRHPGGKVTKKHGIRHVRGSTLRGEIAGRPKEMRGLSNHPHGSIRVSRRQSRNSRNSRLRPATPSASPSPAAARTSRLGA
jgi:hypothetical protein